MKFVEISFTKDSKQDYDSLPIEISDECTKLLKKLKNAGKKLGIPLENKHGRDLNGYYKLYFNKARYRIVYTVKDEILEVTEIGEVLKEFLEIVGVGKRDKELIYKLIWERISQQEEE